MSTNPQSESHELIHGEINDQQIKHYLSIKDATELTRLAATMATNSKSLSPQELIDSVLALQEEAEQGLVRKREQLLSQMNMETVLEIARQLGVLDKSFALENDPVLKDTVKGPVVKLLVKINPFNSHLCPQDQKNKIDEHLKKADSRTSLPRPSLPCNLEEALRYSIDAPTEPWPLLEKAFIDFWGIYQSERSATQEYDYRTDIEEQFKRDRELLADLTSKAKTDQELQPQLSSLKAELDATGKIIDEWKKEKFYVDYFTPSQPAPLQIKHSRESSYERYWKTPVSVKDESSLVFFTTKFHAFWEHHAMNYFKQDEVSQNNQKSLSEIYANEAYQSLEKRESKKWIKRTQEFIKLLKQNKSKKAPVSTENLVDIYAINYSGLKTDKAIADVKNVLGTLCNPGNFNKEPNEIYTVLRQSGLKVVSENTIATCQSLLKNEVL